MQNTTHNVTSKQTSTEMHSVIRIIVLLFIVDKACSSECICKENQEQASCTNQPQNVQEAQTSISIDMSSLQNLPFNGIKRLQIQCGIETLPLSWFAKQGPLTDLNLAHNSIVRIPSNLFESIPNLEKLILSHNKLRNPMRDTFQGLQKLKELDIGHNRISNVEENVLDKMVKLERLYVNNNGLFMIKDYIFEAVNNLMVLDLSYNHIREISPGLFGNNGKLKDLNLAGNYFNMTIPTDMFDDLKKVTTLNLSDCKIQLQSGIFSKTTKLVTLDLSNNNLQQLPTDIFNSLKDLKSLNLAKCRLLNLPEDLFKQNTRLEDLNLSNNNLRTLPQGIFSAARYFKHLKFSNNLIRELPGQIFQQTNLAEIDLSHNLFTDVSLELLNIRTLQNVHLQNNTIAHMSKLDATSGTSPVKFLDLRNNRLVFLTDSFFHVMASLQRLEILGNPWDCQCFEEILEVLAANSIKYASENYYDGKLPVCVVSEHDTCNVDAANLTYYYNVYKNSS